MAMRAQSEDGSTLVRVSDIFYSSIEPSIDLVQLRISSYVKTGAPEVGPIPGANPRPRKLFFENLVEDEDPEECKCFPCSSITIVFMDARFGD